MNNGVIYALLAVSIISIVISVVSLVLILNVLKRQNELIKIYKMRPVENPTALARIMNNNKEDMVQVGKPDAKNYGVIICKKCYASVYENSVSCPVCKTPVGRR